MKCIIFAALLTIGYCLNAKIPKRLEIGEDGGYTGLVVGISNTVGQDYTLIKLIQERLQDASRALYDATEGLAFLKKIHIIVPRNWVMPTEDDIRRYGLNYKGLLLFSSISIYY